MDIVVMNLVDSYPAAILLVLDLGLLCKRLDKILDMTLLVNKDIECILTTKLISTHTRTRIYTRSCSTRSCTYIL